MGSGGSCDINNIRLQHTQRKYERARVIRIVKTVLLNAGLQWT